MNVNTCLLCVLVGSYSGIAFGLYDNTRKRYGDSYKTMTMAATWPVFIALGHYRRDAEAEREMIKTYNEWKRRVYSKFSIQHPK